MGQTTLKGHEHGFADMEANTIEKLKTVKSKVRYILDKYPSTKGDDRILLWKYYQLFESDKVRLTFKVFKDLMRATSPESIRRCRQKIQEGGNYLPTSKTVLKRRRRQSIICEGIHEI